MKLFLLSFVLTYASVSAVPTTQSPRCVWGPPYWCASLDQAQECGATKHCMDTVWKYKILKPQSIETCTMCQVMVGALKDYLADKHTETDIATLVSKVCSVLPNPDWKDQCAGIIEEYGTQVIGMLDKEIDATVICATIRLCNGLEDTVSPYGVKATASVTTQAPPTTECQDCTKFFRDVQQSVTSNETLNGLLELMNQSICSQLGSFGDLCMQFFRDNLPTALQVLAEQIDPSTVCRIFGFCTVDSSYPPALQLPMKNVFKGSRKTPLQYRSSEECDACKEVDQQLVDMIRDRTTQQKIINFVETEVCERLGGVSATCKQVVEEYSPLAFELLANELDPTTLCETIGMCPTPTLYGAKPMIPAKAKPIVLEATFPEKVKAEQVTVKGTEYCALCELVVGEVQSVLAENTTLEELETILKGVCAKLPTKQLQDSCNSGVDTYAPIYMYLLSKELTPKQICTKLDMCAASSIQEKQALDDEFCDICRDVVQQVEVLLVNVSAEEVTKELVSLCPYIPIKQYASMCDQYVKQYCPLIIDFLQSKPDPTQVCALAGVCKTTTHKIFMTKPIPEQLQQSKVEAPPTTACEACNTIVMYADIMLGDDSIKKQVLGELKSLCADIPGEEYKVACESFVDAYGSELYNYLVKKLSAKEVCGKDGLGLCDEAAVEMTKILPSVILSPAKTLPLAVLSPFDTLPLEGAADKSDELTVSKCEVCKEAMEVLEVVLDSKVTKDAIAAALEGLCNALPPNMQGECQELVMDNEQAIIDIAEQELGSVCKKLNVCPAIQQTVHKPAAVMSPYDTLPLIGLEDKKDVKASGTECELCEYVMQFFANYAASEQTEDAIVAALSKLCDDIHSSECKSIVTSYTKIIINYLVLELGPDEICRALTLCPVAAPVKALPEPVHVEMVKVNEGEGGPECTLCKLIIGKAKAVLKENTTMEEFKELLEKACGDFPTTLADQCKVFVDEYYELVYNLLVQEVDVDTICKQLNFCTSGKTEVKASGVCIFCEFAIHLLKDYVNENSSEAEIKAALDALCDKMPVTISRECTDFVNQYTPMLVQMIRNGIDTDKICRAVKACTQASPKDIVTGLGHMSVEAGPLCPLCEFAMKQLEDILKNNKSEEAIRTALEKLCSVLPATISNECKNFVDTYEQQIIDLIVAGASPDKICTAIGLCDADKRTLAMLKTLAKPVKVPAPGNLKCEACQIVCGAVEGYLRQNRSEKDIERLLDQLCDLLPDTVTVQCRAVIQQYTPEIVAKLMKDMDPKEVCPELKLCDKTTSPKKDDNTLYFRPNKQRRLGANKCTYGPAYWCASKENAAKCGAVKHCEMHVWLN